MRKNKQILRKIILITTLIIILCIIVLGIIIYNNKIEQDKQYTIEIEQKNKLAEQEQEKERKENIIDSKTREELRKKFETKEERKKIKEITDKIAKDEKNAELYYDRGELYSYVYEYKKAYDDFTKAIELNPNKAIYYVGRATVYKEKEKKKAEEDIAKSLELPYDLETYKKLGEYYEYKSEYESAIEIYKKALLMKLSDKEKMNLYKKLEDVYYSNSDNVELLELAEKHIKKFPKDYIGYYFKARAYKIVYNTLDDEDEEKVSANKEIIKSYMEGMFMVN